MSLNVLLVLLINNSHWVIFKQNYLFAAMQTPPKNMVLKKISVVHKPHAALSPLQNVFHPRYSIFNI